MSAIFAERDKEFIDALEKAATRLDAMLLEQERVDRLRLEIDFAAAKLAQKMLHLAALCDDVPETIGIERLKESIQDLGITDAVREVIKGAEKPLTATEVKDRLEQFGININQYQNYGAVFHNLLGRLVESGEIEEVPPQEGRPKKAYVWIPAQPKTTFKPRPGALNPSLTNEKAGEIDW